MEHLSHIDIYGIAAAILSMILATVVPILSFKYRKLFLVLSECKTLVDTMIESWSDEKITKEELKEILKEISAIIYTIKR